MPPEPTPSSSCNRLSTTTSSQRDILSHKYYHRCASLRTPWCSFPAHAHPELLQTHCIRCLTAIFSLFLSLPPLQLTVQLFDAILADPGLADVQKAMVAEELAAADKALQDGADEFLQLMSVLSFLMNQRNQY